MKKSPPKKSAKRVVAKARASAGARAEAPRIQADRIERALAFVRRRAGPIAPQVGVVLGSGLGSALSAMKVNTAIPYAQIPGFLPSTVEGHAGQLLLGTLGDLELVVMQGRVHLYEGHAPADVVLPVRALIALGAKRLAITNAAGGVRANLRPGDLMLVRDQLNLTGRNPLLGPNEPALGVRFPDMTDAYSPRLRRLAREAAERLGLELPEGVYAGLLGPSYETPAEIGMLRTLGADAVGMSTVLEVIAARHMGAEILGFSCISNQAAGLSGQPLSHEEVTSTAKAIESRLFGLLAEVLPRMAAD